MREGVWDTSQVFGAAMILSLIPTPYRVAIYAVGLALIAGFSAVAGYNYSEGRHAIWQVKQQDERLDAVYDTLERARAEVKDAQEQAAESAKKLAALDQRQQRERIIYVKSPAAPDCRLDDGTFGLLNDAIRRANGTAAPDPD